MSSLIPVPLFNGYALSNADQCRRCARLALNGVQWFVGTLEVVFGLYFGTTSCSVTPKVLKVQPPVTAEVLAKLATHTLSKLYSSSDLLTYRETPVDIDGNLKRRALCPKSMYYNYFLWLLIHIVLNFSLVINRDDNFKFFIS